MEVDVGGGFGFSVGFEPICIWVIANGCGCSYGFKFVTVGVVDLDGDEDRL